MKAAPQSPLKFNKPNCNCIGIKGLFLWLIVLFPLISSAQVYLLISKPGKIKRHRYFLEDNIYFKPYGEKRKEKTITGFNDLDSLIYLNQVPYHVSDIKWIRHRSYFGTKFGKALMTAGIGYFVIYALNDGISQNFSQADQIFPASAGMFTGGLLLQLITMKTFRNRAWEFKVINTNPM